MDVLFLAYANNPKNPLEHLLHENEEVYKSLSPGMRDQHYLIHREVYATPQNIAYHLIEFREQIVFFSYSGHANQEALIFHKEKGYSQGIAELLGLCPNLKGVFLNGCSTKAQVKKLQEAGVPLVIATSTSVNDKTATDVGISFYQALAEKNTLDEAFKAAKAVALSLKNNITFNFFRDVISVGGEDLNEWGMYVHPEKEEVLNWKLPQKTIPLIPLLPPVNEYLIQELLDGLAKEEIEDVQSLLGKEENGDQVSPRKKKKAILAHLPFILSNQLRKLFARSAENGSVAQGLYDAHGLERLTQLLQTYEVTIELLAVIMLAQYWKHHYGEERYEARLPEIDHFFQLTDKERTTYSFIPLLQAIQADGKKAGYAYVASEVENLVDSAESWQAVRTSASYFENLKLRIDRNEIDAMEALRISFTAEKQLAHFLRPLSFLAHYSLSSVKDIFFLKYPLRPTPIYRHIAVPLTVDVVDLEEDPSQLSRPWETASVLLLAKENPDQFLNLSPFIIDQNAYDKGADLAKLCMFSCIDMQKKCIQYRHIFKPMDAPLVVDEGLMKKGLKGNVHYKYLKDQFGPYNSLLDEAS